MSALYHVLTDIGTVCSNCENNEISLRKTSRASRSFYRKGYDEINENPYSKNRCFGVNYIYELLTAGYKLGPYKKIRVATSLNGFKLGWIMGAALHNTGILMISGI